MDTLKNAIKTHLSWKPKSGGSDAEFAVKEDHYFAEFCRFVCYQFSSNKECFEASLNDLAHGYPLVPMDFSPGISDEDCVGQIGSSFGDYCFSFQYNLRTTNMSFLVTKCEYRHGAIHKVYEKFVFVKMNQSITKQSLQSLFALWNVVGRWEVVYERPA